MQAEKYLFFMYLLAYYKYMPLNN